MAILTRLHESFSFLVDRRLTKHDMPMRTLRLLVGLVGGLSYCGGNANATVNVYLSTSAPASLQAEFIGTATTQYKATITKSPYFADTFGITLFSKIAGQTPAPTPQAPDVATIVKTFVAKATTTYDYGWAAGQEYERKENLNAINLFSVNCSSPTFYDVAVSTESCYSVLWKLYGYINQKNYAEPTVIPGF